jgi:hypothetical protein
VVAAYARAIEARDVAVLRDAYPGMTDKERRSWEEFFASVRDLTADLVVEDVVVTGPVAQATIRGVYRYRNTLRGRPERSPVEFRGVFSTDSSGWRLSAIR